MDQSQTEQAAAPVAGIHGDGSNRSEPGDTSRESSQEASTGTANGLAGTALTSVAVGAVPLDTTKDRRPVRHRLADERKATVHHFSVGGHEGYLMVGLYEDGQPGEIFIRMAKAGSTIAGLMDSFGIAVSLALQYGVPLKVLCDKFSHTRFEPSGWSTNPDIGYAKSLMDYIFRWLALKFLPRDAQPKENASLVTPNGTEVANAAQLASQFTQAASPGPVPHPPSGPETRALQPQLAGVVHEDDAPSCSDCGAIMVRNGACFRCMNCGSTSGCS